MPEPKGGESNKWVKDVGFNVIKEIELSVGGIVQQRNWPCDKCKVMHNARGALLKLSNDEICQMYREAEAKIERN